MFTLEAEVLHGVVPLAEAELLRRFGKRCRILESDDKEIRFTLNGDLRELLYLQLSTAVYLLEHYDISRPKALLGHQNFHRLLGQMRTVENLHPPETFTTFRISAAGHSSSVFQRLKDDLQRETQLTLDEEEAQHLIRIRPATLNPSGWDVLVRLSPRPLSARDWRIFNMQGALNATIAAVMIEMTTPRPHQRYVNLMCGSGTLLMERLLRGEVKQLIGVDIDHEALQGAQVNTPYVPLAQMDVADLGLPRGYFDIIVADLPWGHLVGSIDQNEAVYPQLFGEAARIGTPDATMVLLSHNIGLMEQMIERYSNLWRLEAEQRVSQGGLNPRIYRFHRVAST